MDELNVVKSNGDNIESEKKFKFKMPSSMMIIIGVLFFFIILTWILALTNAKYEVNGSTETVKMIGLLGFGNAIVEGFGNAYSLIFYLFVLGALIEILLVTGTLEAGVGSLVKGLNGKEIILIPLLFVLFSAGGTVYGMQEETIGLFIIVVPALVLAGFDTITGLLVILLGTTTGFAMSTVNPFAVAAGEEVINSVLDPTGLLELSVTGVGILFRLVWWVVFTAIGASFVTTYAYFAKKDEKYSFNSKNKIAEDKEWVAQNFKGIDEIPQMTVRQKIAITIFMSLFLIMIVMMIPWPDLLGYDGVDVLGWPTWIAWLFNGVFQPGAWYFGELVMLFSLGTIIIIMILKMPLSQASKVSWDGAKTMFSVAILIGVARAIPQVLSASGTQDWLVQSMTSGLSGISSISFVYMMVPILFVLSLIIPSTSGLAGAALPIITGAAVAATGTEISGVVVANESSVELMSAVLIVFLVTCGMANMFIPTQSVVMAQMDASHVSYITALKPIGIYIGIMMLILLAFVVPSTLILMPSL